MNADTKYNYKKPLRIVPVIIFGLILILQLYVFVLMFTTFSHLLNFTVPIWIGVVFVFIVYMINLDIDSDLKMTWILITVAVPVFGVLMFIFLHVPGRKLIYKNIKRRQKIAAPYSKQNIEVLNELKDIDKRKAGLANYLYGFGFPIYKNTDTEYFELGEDVFHQMFIDMENAEKFILLEFFLISPGYILDRVYDILSRKVKEGVEVKFLYDGTNKFFLAESLFDKFKEAGIECREYMPVHPILTTVHNNRDHRKIVIIDNKIGYTGGINLADEYANLYDKNGHWIDSGIKIAGEAVRSMTNMFLQMWDLSNEEDNHKKYLEEKSSVKRDELSFVIPFCENPFDGVSVSENVYMDVINSAIDYVYISTPYITISEKMTQSLINAAKRGVDVKMFLPHIGDHKGIPLMVARTYYTDLARSGVKIYEYKPGFIHAKTVVSDDCTSIVGTINMDYRSFYLHYEDAVLVYEEKIAGKIKTFWDETIEKSILVTEEEYKKFSLISRMFGRILRILAALM